LEKKKDSRLTECSLSLKPDRIDTGARKKEPQKEKNDFESKRHLGKGSASETKLGKLGERHLQMYPDLKEERGITYAKNRKVSIFL